MPRLRTTPEPGERHLKSVPTAWDTARRIVATMAAIDRFVTEHPELREDWEEDKRVIALDDRRKQCSTASDPLPY